MKQTYILFILFVLSFQLSAQTVERFITIDQFGYLPVSQKVAVIKDPQTGFDADESFTPGDHYLVVNASNGNRVLRGQPAIWNSGKTDTSSGDKAWHFDFTALTDTGHYYILDSVNNVRSYEFEISPDVYNDVLKHAVRTFFYQRVGFAKEARFAGAAWADGASHVGPLQDKNCRPYNARTNAAAERDLTGGWYDAGDYNKYTTWTASYVVEMMKAFIENPAAWGDDYNIPESGNGIPDLLDEAKWGIDFLLRMQEDNGSVLCIVSESHASPPSSATGQSVYGPATTAATLNTAAALAISAKVFRSVNMITYADTLIKAAEKAWQWGSANPSVLFHNNSSANGSLGVGAGDQEINDYGRFIAKMKAACYLFESTGKTAYRTYFDSNYQSVHLLQWNFAYPYEQSEQDILLYYSSLNNSSATVANQIKTTYRNAMLNNTENFPAYFSVKDPYLAHMENYTWGSNNQKGATGSMFYNIIQYKIDQAKNADALNAASGYVHYLHGVNPLNLAYLSNMYSFGGDSCVNEFYHSWFANGSAKWDRVGTSLYGPAPGFVTGGPNPSYNWDGCCNTPDCGSGANNAICTSEDISPPKDQPKQKSYKDFNTSWPLNSWEVTENSCGYQVSYIRLLSKFVKGYDCHGDSAGTATFDLCGICSGGNTGREPAAETCDCPGKTSESNLTITSCTPYISPDGNIYSTSGQYKDTIPNVSGCDSIITIDLTIPVIQTEVNQTGDTLTAAFAGQSYRWLRCDNNYTEIEGDTGVVFIPSVTGQYAVEITSQGCRDTSQCISIEISGIWKNEMGPGLKVYPNPVSNCIFIDLPESYDVVYIELQSLYGQVLIRKQYSRIKNISLPIELPSGTYLLTLRNHLNQSAVVKIVKR